MRGFSGRRWGALVAAIVPAAALLGATPALADRDHGDRGRHQREWRHHDHRQDHGRRHWRDDHRSSHDYRDRHDRRVVIVRPPPRVIYREPPRVYYVEPHRYRYYEPTPGVSGSVTFRF